MSLSTGPDLGERRRDAGSLALRAQGRGEVAQPGLRRRVRSEARQGVRTGERRHVHDVPLAAGPHRRDHFAAEQHRSDEVQRDQLTNALGLEVDEGTGEVDAGVVDQHVDRSVGLDRADQWLDRASIRQVGRVSLAAELGREAGDRIMRSGDQRHPSAFARQPRRDARADPSRSSGHHDSRACEVHRVPTHSRDPRAGMFSPLLTKRPGRGDRRDHRARSTSGGRR